MYNLSSRKEGVRYHAHFARRSVSLRQGVWYEGTRLCNAAKRYGRGWGMVCLFPLVSTAHDRILMACDLSVRCNRHTVVIPPSGRNILKRRPGVTRTRMEKGKEQKGGKAKQAKRDARRYLPKRVQLGSVSRKHNRNAVALCQVMLGRLYKWWKERSGGRMIYA